MDHSRQQIKEELLEHVSQVLTAISMKSKTLEHCLAQDHPQEAQTARDIHEMAKQLIISNRHMAQRLDSTHMPNED